MRSRLEERREAKTARILPEPWKQVAVNIEEQSILALGNSHSASQFLYPSTLILFFPALPAWAWENLMTSNKKSHKAPHTPSLQPFACWGGGLLATHGGRHLGLPLFPRTRMGLRWVGNHELLSS